MNEKEIESLANKIILKMMKIKTMEDWMHDSQYSEKALEKDYNDLNMTEEESAIGEIAKLMTLKNIFEDKEEYEKCNIVKKRIQIVNDILKNYK